MLAVQESHGIARKEFDTFISELPHPPNRFQLKVLESIAGLNDITGNILVEAVAGSGKTTLLMQIAQLLVKMGVSGNDAMFLAFNTKIRDEMTKRLPPGWSAINSHRLGNSVLGKTRVDYRKVRTIVENDFKAKFGRSSWWSRYKMFENLMSKAMLNGLKMTDLTPDELTALPQQLLRIATHYGILNLEGDDAEDMEQAINWMIERFPNYVAQMQHRYNADGAITFDEMLYWPIMLDLPFEKHSYVFVDECQDLNGLQQAMITRSLKSGGRVIAVGDLRQAIYGFSGADAKAFENIKNQFDMTVLPLNINYRCPPNHLDLARAIVPQIEAGLDTQGEIIYAEVKDRSERDQNAGSEIDTPAKRLKKGTIVMCRLTAPLVGMYFDLVGEFATYDRTKRMPVKMLGRDIGKQLGSMLDKVKKMPAFEYERAIEFLEEYGKRQRQFLIQKEASEAQLTQLDDSIEVLQICVQNMDATSINELKSEVKDLFGDEGDKDFDIDAGITLMTVHRAKGLEADHTAIIAPDKMPLSWQGQKPWEFEQERNILYVALTRAKKTLTVFGPEGSLNVNATPDDAKKARFNKNGIEEKVVEEDVTDKLPEPEDDEQKNDNATPFDDASEQTVEEADAPVTPPALPVLDDSAFREAALDVHPDDFNAPLTLDDIADATDPDAAPVLSIVERGDDKNASSEINTDDTPDPIITKLKDWHQKPLFDDGDEPKVTGDLKKDLVAFKKSKLAPQADPERETAPMPDAQTITHEPRTIAPTVTRKRKTVAQVVETINDVQTLDTMIELLQSRRDELIAQQN